MKSISVLFLLATIKLTSCIQTNTLISSKDVLGYYVYDPIDTIDNEPFCQLLRIDSARVKCLQDCPDGMAPIYNEADAEWHVLMRLCSKKHYEEALEQYNKKQQGIRIALPTSSMQFDLDFYVIGGLLFDVLETKEAANRFVGFLELDKLVTESAMNLSTAEGGDGYVPPHCAIMVKLLGEMYLLQGEWQKAESLIEPYRDALYLLSDDSLQNEEDVLDFQIEVYSAYGDWESVKGAFVEHREFLVRHAKETGMDLSREIDAIEGMIEYME